MKRNLKIAAQMAALVLVVVSFLLAYRLDHVRNPSMFIELDGAVGCGVMILIAAFLYQVSRQLQRVSHH